MKAALPYLLAIATVLGFGWACYSFGVHVRGIEADLAASEELATARKNLIKANQRVQDAEDRLSAVTAERDQLRQKEIDRVNSQHDSFVSDVRSGAVRVSIPVRSAACAPTTNADQTPVGQHQEARAELAPQAAADLAAITRDGDIAIVDLNTCIDEYNDARKAAASLNHDQTTTE